MGVNMQRNGPRRNKARYLTDSLGRVRRLTNNAGRLALLVKVQLPNDRCDDCR